MTALFNFESWLVAWLTLLAPWKMALIVSAIFTALVCGWRLKNFSHPSLTRWSALVRHMSSLLLFLPSIIILTVGLVFLGLTGAVAMILGVQMKVWANSQLHIYGIILGLVAGGFFGGMFFYRWIPGWEMPKQSGVNEAPPRALKLYDPEDYFNVE